MTDSRVRFAVVGCGVISQVHFEAIASIPEAELAAVYDVVAERAEQVAEQYGARAYHSYEALLGDPDIDAVCLCTPSGLHPEQTIAAARAGKHVVCEKPLAIHLEDADRMNAVCTEHGVWLATIFPRRMSPSAQYVKRLIADGALGKLSLCSAYVKCYRDQHYYDSAGWRGTWSMDGGGVLMNQGIHSVDLLQWLAGPVEALQGRAAAVLRNIEVEDTVTALLRYRSGALGVIEATTTAYNQPGHCIAIHGDLGTVVLTGDTITSLDIVGETADIPEFPPFQIVPDGHRMQIRDMALAIREGRPPSVPGTDARHSLEIILGTYTSSRTGQEVIMS